MHSAGQIHSQGRGPALGLEAQTGCRPPAHVSNRQTRGWCRPHDSLQSLARAGPCESSPAQTAKRVAVSDRQKRNQAGARESRERVTWVRQATSGPSKHTVMEKVAGREDANTAARETPDVQPQGGSAGRKGCDEKLRPERVVPTEPSTSEELRDLPTREEPQTQPWELVTAERGDHCSLKGPQAQVMGLGWGAGCPGQTGLGEFIRTETTLILKVSSVLN